MRLIRTLLVTPGFRAIFDGFDVLHRSGVYMCCVMLLVAAKESTTALAITQGPGNPEASVRMTIDTIKGLSY